jgi:hypothetical protein
MREEPGRVISEGVISQARQIASQSRFISRTMAACTSLAASKLDPNTMVGLGGLEPPTSPLSELRSLVTDLPVPVLWS